MPRVPVARLTATSSARRVGTASTDPSGRSALSGIAGESGAGSIASAPSSAPASRSLPACVADARVSISARSESSRSRRSASRSAAGRASRAGVTSDAASVGSDARDDDPSCSRATPDCCSRVGVSRPDDDDDDAAAAAAADDDDDDDDAKSSHDKKKKSQKKSRREASLGVVPMVAEDDSIKASSSCAPVHVKSRHGVFRQYNKACMGDEERPLGCDAKSSEGCQSCFIDGSAAATQVKSYARCSHHVCDAYDVKGCDPNPNERVVEEESSSGTEKDRLGSPKRAPTVPRRQKMFANPASTPDADAETEVCLPNLEDAKRGIFQYSERYCRTLGHTDVDYSGCISVGKSSCRMCVTKSARSSSAAFSVCPRAVCEHHDLLYQQCLEDAEN